MDEYIIEWRDDTTMKVVGVESWNIALDLYYAIKSDKRPSFVMLKRKRADHCYEIELCHINHELFRSKETCTQKADKRTERREVSVEWVNYSASDGGKTE